MTSLALRCVEVHIFLSYPTLTISCIPLCSYRGLDRDDLLILLNLYYHSQTQGSSYACDPCMFAPRIPNNNCSFFLVLDILLGPVWPHLARTGPIPDHASCPGYVRSCDAPLFVTSLQKVISLQKRAI